MESSIPIGLRFLGSFTVCLTVIGAFISTASRDSSDVREGVVSSAIKDDDQEGPSTAPVLRTAVRALSTAGAGEVCRF